MAAWLRKAAARIGHRGAALAVFAGTAFAYGSGLLSGYQPTFANALHIPVGYFGWRSSSPAYSP
jgi:hypothetical protein